MSVPIIAVTGTKGKTSIIRALDHILAPYVDVRLRVDTEGAWVNGRQKFTHQDSRRIWGLAPANAPGRFLVLLPQKQTSRAALLECNLFCSKTCGLGYNSHKVGVFTNVYSDHLGADKKLQSKADIARAKSFIFSRIGQDGFAVYNADDPLILSQLSRIPASKNIKTIACSLVDNPKKLPTDAAIFIKDGDIKFNFGGKTRSLGNINQFKMYVPGFEPSAMNILLLLGAVVGYFGGRLSREVLERAQSYKPADKDGRLIVFSTRSGTKVVFDYAHEQKSLRAVADFAHKLAPTGEIIGVLRLSPTRTDGLIQKTARNISKKYNRFVIYDKIDGINRKPDKSLETFRKEKIGYTSLVFTRALKKAGAAYVERITEEKKALQRASELAKKGDVIVYIQGNNAQDSLNLLQKRFRKLERLPV